MEYNPYFLNKEQEELVLAIAKGNPGALRVTMELQYFSKWLQILRWLKDNEYIGSKLWELYKDKYGCNVINMGNFVEEKMHNERINKSIDNQNIANIPIYSPPQQRMR